MELTTCSERIRSVFPGVNLDQAKHVNEGMQFAVIIAEDWVFRFTRGDWGISCLGNEARVLELLRPRV